MLNLFVFVYINYYLCKMSIEEKKYKILNLMMWSEEEQDDDVVCTSLSDEYTKIYCEEYDDVYPDSNKNIGKPRYSYLPLRVIRRHTYDKLNIDLFCKENSECYEIDFNIWNPEYTGGRGNMTIKYKSNKK